MTTAIILAGGVGARLGKGIPKQFVKVLGKPILAYTLEKFQNNKQIDAIEIVSHKDYVEDCQAIVREYGISKVNWYVNGGASYPESSVNGLFFLRDFLLRTPEGEPLAECTSSWLVLDVATRHLVRPEALVDLLQVDPGTVESAIAEPAPKILFPRDAEPEPAGEHTVAYSDLDIIGHTNNARYVVWAMDALPYGRVSSCRVRDVFINFNKETVPGETVALSRTCREDACYVEGKVEGKSVFTAKFVF